MPKQQERKKKNLDNVKLDLLKKKRKHVSFLQKAIKNSGRPFFNLTLNALKKRDFLRFDITLLPNNVFCSLKDIKKNKLISLVSGGRYKMKISKKKLKYSSKFIITNFFKELKNKKVKFSKPLVLVMTIPSNLKRRTVEDTLKLLKHISKKRLLVYVKPKKIFNGCRAKKQIRKKQKRYAVYK